MVKISSEQLTIGLVFVATAVLACLAPAQSDTWWQLRAGEEIRRTWVIPFVETYSYTARGQPWPNHEWLTELLFYSVHRVGGMMLLAALCGLCIVGAQMLTWRLTRGRFEVRLGLFVLGLTASVPAWSLRPQVASMLCFAMVCHLLANRRYGWLPFITLVWANLHGAVALGVAATGVVLAVEAVRERRLPVALAAASVGTISATALTPMGFGLWRLILDYGQHAKTQGISEWLPPDLPPDYFAFWAIAFALPIGVALNHRRIDDRAWRLLAIAFCVLPLALTAHRNVAMFLIAAVPALSAVAATRIPGARTVDDRRFANTAVFAVAVMAAAAFVVTSWVRAPQARGWQPIRPQAVIAAESCRGPIYNSLDVGGILIWFARRQPVFIDNRNDPYPLDLLQDNLRVEQTGDFTDLFDRFLVRCAIVETSSLVGQRLAVDARWRRSYGDAQYSVFARP